MITVDQVANAALKLQRATQNREGYDPISGFSLGAIVEWLHEAALRRAGLPGEN